VSKRFAILAVSCVVAFACVAVAYGQAVRITEFDAFAPEDPNDADGMAILNHDPDEDKTIAQIILTDLLPNTEYVVALAVPEYWEPQYVEPGSAEALLEPNPEYYNDFFFPIAAKNQLTDGKGQLTLHDSTGPDSGDFTNSDVLIILQSDWDAAFPPDPGRPEAPNLLIPVRMIGYNGTPAP
jgi:hypothetical protein